MIKQELDSFVLVRDQAKRRFNITLPAPPDGYYWSLDEPGTDCIRLGSTTESHRGWVRANNAEVVVRRTLHEKEQGKRPKMLQILNKADDVQQAVIMLHTLICLGEPT